MEGYVDHSACYLLTKRRFWGVFWVDVSTDALAEAAFRDIAGELRSPTRTVEGAQRGLANVRKPWLLVLDNADNPHVDYQRYFPPCRFGMVIMTTRNDECHLHGTKTVPLDGLSTSEARDLLLMAAKIPCDQKEMLKDDAQIVASLLQSHPLAIIQAGSYVSCSHCTLADYPQVFARQRKRLLKFRPIQAQSRYRDVYTTFEASREILQSSHTEAAEDAMQLLPVLASYGPSRLPLPIFEAGWMVAREIFSSLGRRDASVEEFFLLWNVTLLPPFVQAGSDAWDHFRLIEAVNLLKAFCLVSTNTYNGSLSVSMHPLIYAWARDRLDSMEQHTSWLTTGCLFSISTQNLDFWEKYGPQLQPHLQVLTVWDTGRMFASEPPEMIVHIISHCGRLLDHLRDNSKLLVLMQNVFNHLKLDERVVDERWIDLYALRARSLSRNHNCKEALSMLEQLVKNQEQELAEDDAFLLNLRVELASVYVADGQHQKGTVLLEEVMKMKGKNLPEDDVSLLISQNLLAHTYTAAGQVKEAVSLLEHVVKIERQTTAEGCLLQLEAQESLANVYMVDGQVKEAVLLLEHVVKNRQQRLAEDHPHRVAAQDTLAWAYSAVGQVKEAVLMLEQVVKVRRQILAEDDPSRLASECDLAAASWNLGPEHHESSLQLMEHVVELRRRILNKDHPDLMDSETSLQRMKDELGKCVCKRNNKRKRASDHDH